MVVALLGILKAGGAYVPLQADYPPQRLMLMLEDTEAPVLITTWTTQIYLPITAGNSCHWTPPQTEIESSSRDNLTGVVVPRLGLRHVHVRLDRPAERDEYRPSGRRAARAKHQLSRFDPAGRVLAAGVAGL